MAAISTCLLPQNGDAMARPDYQCSRPGHVLLAPQMNDPWLVGLEHSGVVFVSCIVASLVPILDPIRV